MAAPAPSSNQYHNGAGRSRNIIPYNNSRGRFDNGPLSTSTAKIPKDETRAGAYSRSRNQPRSASSGTVTAGRGRTDMASYASAATLPSGQNSISGHGKLHRRSGSGSSLPGPPSPFTGAHSQFTTPFATYEESSPAASTTPAMIATPKIKPYLRKLSSPKQDQGKLDLDRPTLENARLAGLGIHDFPTRSASDLNLAHSGRRGAHARTTSIGSQMSTASGTLRANQPFVHPMRQTPRPFTPPTGSSDASFVNEEEANESDDVLEDDFRLGHGFRTRRSLSISSFPVIAPTPLSQTYTADELGLVPKLTSVSQSNLSVKSGRSARSSKSRLGKSQRENERSFDLPTSPSSRTSFDRAFSFVSKRSEPDFQTRDERIRAARRKFDEKEASKTRKSEKEALRRRATDEAKREQQQQDRHNKQKTAEASERARITKPNPNGETKSSAWKGKKSEESVSEKLHSRSYDEYRPANPMSLPRKGLQAGTSEKTPRAQERKAGGPQSGWVRFVAWLRTRMLSCGGGR